MIKIQNLNFGYQKPEPLFSNLNLTIPDGGIYGLFGKNGVGKTSLLKVIAGLVFPEGGSCEVFTLKPAERHPGFLSELYFVPEDLFVPRITATHYCKNYAPFYPRFDKNIYLDAIKEFAVPENKVLSEMSYGQKKKFYIAFGMATQCRLFIMDEPTNGLDIPSKAQFRKLLATHFSDQRIFIISTHQIHDVQNLVDTLIVLDQGKIRFHNSITTLMKRIAFSRQATEPNANECLYAEKQIGGYIVIKENHAGIETEIDLEILLNGLLINPAAFDKILV